MSNANKISRNYENVNKGIYAGEGVFDIPKLKPLQLSKNLCRFIGFNYAASCKKEREDTGIHFFLEDYQFIRLWNNIDYYLPLLSQFKYIMSPDFSLFVDYPKALQIYNHYRKHWIGAYMQENGIQVIPTISWSDRDSYEWCFDGEPTHGVVSISSVGAMQTRHTQELFLMGYHEMLRRINPDKIIFYGAIPDECKNDKILHLESYQKRFRHI